MVYHCAPLYVARTLRRVAGWPGVGRFRSYEVSSRGSGRSRAPAPAGRDRRGTVISTTVALPQNGVSAPRPLYAFRTCSLGKSAPPSDPVAAFMGAGVHQNAKYNCSISILGKLNNLLIILAIFRAVCPGFDFP